ncbi:MAG: methyltransferase domain-containing protein [Pacificimonas sp.]|jgi:SAM-dependent methyltransferase|nr:methyltransferase domain-containing protein [Pacificimonas sp.]
MTLAARFRRYYQGQEGRRAARQLAYLVAPMVRQEPQVRFLAIGYPRPLLIGLKPDRFERIALLVTEGVPAAYWPHRGDTNCAAAGHADDLPFSGALFDQVLLVHALEHGNAADILTEVNRVLAPAGDLIILVPNRASLWTNSARTPFGLGRPYRRSELERLLNAQGFEAQKWRTALLAAPRRSLNWLNRWPLPLLGGLGGVHIVLAKKSGGPAAAAVRRRGRARRPLLAPAPQVAARAMPLRRPPGWPPRSRPTTDRP